MTTETPIRNSNYRHLYNFLRVLNEEQIKKLRRVVVGSQDVNSFTETEIRELEEKLEQTSKVTGER